MTSYFAKKPIYWFSAGVMVRQLVSFIMLPIYTQYLTPSDYGIIAILTVIVATYELILGAQFGRALPKFYYDREARADRDTLVGTALFVTMAASAIGVLIFFLSSQYIATYAFESPNLRVVLEAYSFILLATAIESYIMILFRLQNHPALFFIFSVGKLFAQLSLNIYTVVILDMGVAGVMYSAVLSSVLFAGISLMYWLRTCSIRFDWSLLRPLFIFTWPLWLAGGGDLYVGILTNAVIKEFVGLAEVGIYFLATKFCMMMSMLVWRPFSEWWQTERFKLVNNESEHKKIRLIYNLITYVLSAAAVVVSIGGAAVLKLMVNEGFYPVLSIMYVLIFAKILFHLTQLYYLPILHVGRTTLIAKISFIKAIFMTLFFIPSVYYMGLKGAVLGVVFTTAVLLFIVRGYANKCFDMDTNFLKSKVIVMLSFSYSFIWIQNIDLAENLDSILIKSFSAIALFLVILGSVFFIDKQTKSFLIESMKKRKEV